MDRLVCPVRTKDGLAALVVREPAQAAPPLPPSPHAARERWAGWFTLVTLPLERVDRRLVPGRELLLGAWRDLGAVEGASARALSLLLRVLIETVPESQRVELPGPRLDEPAAPVRPTAAHPRAYRGTKWRPPTAARPARVDLRPLLCDGRHVGALLSSLRAHAAPAGRMLVDAGLAPERVARVVADLKTAKQAEPWLAYHHGVPGPRRVELGPAWRRLGHCVRGQEGAMRRLLALRGRLAIERDAALLAACTCVVEAAAGLAWLEVIAAAPQEHQAALATLLVHAHAHRCDPSRFEGAFEREHAGCPMERYLHRADTYVRGIGAGLSSEYLRAGFRLADAVDPDHRFSLPAGDSPVPEQSLGELLGRVLDANDFSAWTLMALWRQLGNLPGLEQVLRRVPWTRLSPDAAWALTTLFADFSVQRDERPALVAKWRAFRARLEPVLEALEQLQPARQAGFVKIIDQSTWDADAGLIERQSAALLMFALRLSRPPLPGMAHVSYALEGFVRHRDASVVEAFLRAPDASFLKFERVCARRNAAGLVGDAMKVLVDLQPELAIRGFLEQPEKLARTARLLGILATPELRELLTEFSAHPLVRRDPFEGSSAADAARTLARWCQGPVASPLPRKVREHFEMGRPLSPAQVARGLEVAHQRLTLVRLQLLEQVALERLRRRLPAHTDDPRQRHALEYATAISENRRALRRFLGHYLAGERDWLSTHPETVRWFRKHPRIDPTLWLSGIEVAGEAPGHGRVRIRLETDPLEALRLGSYVGTCLGVGGLCDYSAAAVVLDANKQVLYARDARGRVVARQLLAIAEDERLVCFSVYPLGASAALRALFRDYDRRFAEALRLPLAGPREDYEVASFIATGFWDDGAWEPEEHEADESARGVHSATGLRGARRVSGRGH